MRSIGNVLDEHKGIGHGFDILRIFLATSVVLWHSFYLVTGSDDNYHGTALWLYKFAVLPCFFGLSGFLVAGSATRLKLPEFLTNRALRIIPALAVEVFLSALILGPLFTTTSLANYFTDREFITYFLNLVGRIHFQLPGVFKDHYSIFVNGSLWTVPFEITCYAVLAVIIFFGALKKPAIIAAIVVAYFLGAIVYVNVLGVPEAHGLVSGLIAFLYAPNVNNASGPALVPIFLVGCLSYILRYKIAYDIRLFLGCVVLFIVIALIGNRTWELQPAFQFAATFIFIYCTIYIGVTNVWWPKFLKKNDYSYGIYLYGWPLQQTAVALFPKMTNPWLGFLIVMPFLVCFAALSWHLVEKPVLRLRKNFTFFQDRIREVRSAT